LFFNPVYDIFHSTTVAGILLQDRKVVTVTSKDSLTAVLTLLHESKLMAAPIVSEGKYDGTISTLDILRFLFQKAMPCPKEQGEGEAKLAEDSSESPNLCIDPTILDSSTVENVLSLPYTTWGRTEAANHPYACVMADDPLSKPARLFQKGHWRLPVRNEQGVISNIISQSDVIRFVAKHCAKDPKLMILNHMLLSDDGISSDVVSVTDKDSVGLALQTMWLHGVSCLAIVHHQTGKLVGNFSASDLRHGLHLLRLVKESTPAQAAGDSPVSPADQERAPSNTSSPAVPPPAGPSPEVLSLADSSGTTLFEDTVGDFLARVSPEALNPIVLQSGSSLSDAILELAGNHLHHLWAVDADYKPISCLSLTDVLSTLRQLKVLRPPPILRLFEQSANEFNHFLSLLRALDNQTLLSNVMIPQVAPQVVPTQEAMRRAPQPELIRQEVDAPSFTDLGRSITAALCPILNQGDFLSALLQDPSQAQAQDLESFVSNMMTQTQPRPVPQSVHQPRDMPATPVVPAPGGDTVEVVEFKLNCPKNHGLKTHTASQTLYMCDVCNCALPEGTMLKGCRICDWDMCTLCEKEARGVVMVHVQLPLQIDPSDISVRYAIRNRLPMLDIDICLSKTCIHYEARLPYALSIAQVRAATHMVVANNTFQIVFPAGLPARIVQDTDARTIMSRSEGSPCIETPTTSGIQPILDRHATRSGKSPRVTSIPRVQAHCQSQRQEKHAEQAQASQQRMFARGSPSTESSVRIPIH
jgi:CBS domain-containing protein